MKLSDQSQYTGQEWYPDSGASAHITNDGSQLQSAQPYLGNDQVIVGNGDYLPISHIGSIPLHTPKGILPLADVLVCPAITKSLLSVSKLTSDYPCEFTFDDECVLVKDKVTKQVITQGRRHKDLYVLKDIRFQAFYSSRQQAACEKIWHQRLGHAHADILRLLSSTKSILLNKSSVQSVCDACHFEKSCKLPFLTFEFISSRPLERIQCDLWDPSPVISNQGFKFYVIFIDHHTRFTWFYPLKTKSDFYYVFVRFIQLVENQFECRIQQFQCDGGREFISKEFLTLLSQAGIQQRISCPHTPQQNGLSERKHRHLTELGLTMMFHARVPQQFWVDLLPSTALPDNKSPFQLLHNSAPVYTALRVFGCKCFPSLRPYMQNKLDPKSLAWVFLDYNKKYKGYRCFYPPTGRVFISRHVLFDENSFPFENLYSKFHTDTNSNLLNAWRDAHLAPQVVSSDQDSPHEEELPPAPVPLVPAPATPEAVSPPVSPVMSDHQHSDDEDPLPEAPIAEPPPLHHMTTRARAGIIKPNPRYALITVKVEFTESKSLKAALQHPGWNKAMGVEVDSMSETETFELVPSSDDQNPLSCGWVHKVKRNADGSVLKLKSRLVARGNEQ